MSESQNIERRQSWHDDYLKVVCGFANAIKIIEACKEAGLAEPLIEETNGVIAVTLFNGEFGRNSEEIRKKCGNDL
ncbi:MAG: hypothetical protein R2879_18220 [Saprospiraceae bacterium]